MTNEDPSNNLLSFLLVIYELLDTDARGRVRIAAGAKPPPWFKDFMISIHDGFPPDEYIHEILFNLCRETDAQFTKLQTNEEPNFDDIVSEVVDEVAMTFADANSASKGATRKWMMWQDGRNWQYIDAVLGLKDPPKVDFEGLLYEAMERQVRVVAHRIATYISDFEAEDEETEDAEPATPTTPQCPTPSTTSSN